MPSEHRICAAPSPAPGLAGGGGGPLPITCASRGVDGRAASYRSDTHTDSTKHVDRRASSRDRLWRFGL